jgi:hypothetical protein
MRERVLKCNHGTEQLPQYKLRREAGPAAHWTWYVVPGEKPNPPAYSRIELAATKDRAPRICSLCSIQKPYVRQQFDGLRRSGPFALSDFYFLFFP